MNDHPLLTLFNKIRDNNPNIILSGSLALALQNVQLRKEPEDIDIHLPYGAKFDPPSGLVAKGSTFYADEDKIERTSYHFEIDNRRYKVDVFQPVNGSVIEPITIYCGNILCTHYIDILHFKLKHSFNKRSTTSIKHAVDLVYVLLGNTNIQSKNLFQTLQEFTSHTNRDLSIIYPVISLKRPLIFFDTETTGIDKGKDRIVELSTIKFFPSGEREIKTQRFNPTVPIPPEATAVHHITDEDLKDKPTFSEKASEIARYFEGCDFAGYNILEFDLPIIAQEFLRHDSNMDLPFKSTTKFLDALKIFYQHERRDLAAAYKFYCGKDLKNAHSAEADTLATVEILNRQLALYNIENSVDAIHNISINGSDIIDYDKKFGRNGSGVIVFMFGKYKGYRALDYPEYLYWMLDQDFLIHTKYIIKQMLDGKLVDLDLTKDLPF